MFKRLLPQFFGLLVLSLSVSCTHKNQVQPLDCLKAKLNGYDITLYLSDSKKAQAQGLMYVKHLHQNSGMLFEFPAPTSAGFWMKNTLINLDLAFLDSNLVVKQLQTMRLHDHQGPFKIYKPQQPYSYALEMNAHWFTKHHIKPGMLLKVLSRTTCQLTRSVPAK